MRATLFCKYGPMNGSTFQLEHETTIGRARTNRVVLSNRHISGRHARIFHDPNKDCFMVEDMGSTNGTFLDGSRIDEPQQLGMMHLLNFGRFADFFFVQGDIQPKEAEPQLVAGPGTQAHAAPERVPSLLQEVLKPAGDAHATCYKHAPAAVPGGLRQRLKAGPKFCLVIDGPEGTTTFPLRKGPNLLGRAKEATMRMDSGEISRLHAIITLEENGIFIEDKGSTNHTWCEGKQVTQRCPISPGTRLAFGKLKALLTTMEEVSHE